MGTDAAAQTQYSDILDSRQAAAMLRLSVASLEKKARKGLIPGAKPGRHWVFFRPDLVDYIRSQYKDHGQAVDGGHLCQSTHGKTRRITGSDFKSLDDECEKILGL